MFDHRIKLINKKNFVMICSDLTLKKQVETKYKTAISSLQGSSIQGVLFCQCTPHTHIHTPTCSEYNEGYLTSLFFTHIFVCHENLLFTIEI